MLSLVSILLTLAGVGVARGELPNGRYRSAHFVLHISRTSNTPRLLDELERAYQHVREYGFSLPSSIDAWSYGSTDDFVRKSGAARYNLAFAAGRTIHLQPLSLLLRRGELPRALRHELTHIALATAAEKGLPRWFNEGTAMVVAGERHPETIKFPNLEALERTLTQSKSYDTLRSAYGTAARLVAQFVETNGREKLIELIRSVAGSGGFTRKYNALAAAAHRAFCKNPCIAYSFLARHRRGRYLLPLQNRRFEVWYEFLLVDYPYTEACSPC